MIRRDSPALCNETYIAKLNCINLVKRPKTCRNPHKQWFRGKKRDHIGMALLKSGLRSY